MHKFYLSVNDMTVWEHDDQDHEDDKEDGFTIRNVGGLESGYGNFKLLLWISYSINESVVK